MPTLDLTTDHHDRLAALRDELAAVHADDYTSVTDSDTMAYLLDLAEAVDDPGRRAEPDTPSAEPDTAADTATDPFPRAELEAALSERNRRHTDAADEAPMDLYTIAATYDITGRSNMTKQELITAICDTVAERYTDPLAPTDLRLPTREPATDDNAAVEAPASDDTAEDATAADAPDSESAPDTAPSTSDAPDTDADTATTDADDAQLNTMLSLLETHQEKWREADGDARYEVDLPDGGVAQARTKDDVRATLFKHY